MVPTLGSERLVKLALEEEYDEGPGGKVSGEKGEKRWNGYLCFSKACPLKSHGRNGTQPRASQDHRADRHLGQEERLEGTTAQGLRAEDAEVRLGFECLPRVTLGSCSTSAFLLCKMGC